MSDGDYVPLSANPTVKEWIDLWLALVKPTIRLRTYDDYNRVLRTKVIPKIGNKPLSAVTGIDCQIMLNEYAKYLSPVTVNDIRRRLKVVFKAAYNQNLIMRNPAEFTRAIHEPKKQIVAMSEKQVVRLLAALDSGLYVFPDGKRYQENRFQVYNKACVRVLIYLALATGCRIGELLALSWDCVGFYDEEKAVIRIIKSLSHTSMGERLEEVKTRSSYRNIRVDKTILQLLHKWKWQQDAYKNILRNQYDDSLNLVITNAFGNPLCLSNFYKRYWSKLIQYVGLPDKYTFHSLRRTHATLLLKHGVNVKVVSERLGHSSTSVTMNVYAGMLPDMQYQAVEAWEQIMSTSKKPPEVTGSLFTAHRYQHYSR